MPEVTLSADAGRVPGSRSTGRLRTEGKVPGVVYGHGIDPVSVSVDRRALRAALHTDAGQNALINLEVGSAKHLTIVKDLQRHPVRNDVIHVDFIVVSRDEIVTVDVPIVLEGEAKAVLSNDGTVDQHLHSLSVQAKPGNIPTEIRIDISALAIGDHIRVGDLQLPAGVATEIDPDETIVAAQVSSGAIEAEARDEAEGEAAAAEGEDGSPAASGESTDE
jgi:large subunit ribosomal protein L25